MAKNASSDRIDKAGYQGGEPIHNVNSAVVSDHLHMSEIQPRPDWYHAWEHWRPLWLQECAGEFFGVFFYVYAGVAATAVFNIGLLTGQNLGSIYAVAFSYGIGVAFSVIVCAMSSGGHFNPAFTVCHTIYKGFPLRKVPYFIASQVAGAFVAALIVYAQYRPFIMEIEETLIAAGKESKIYTAQGTAGIFAGYAPVGAHLGWTFVNEFFADFFIGLVFWGATDPSNVFVSAASIPFVVGFAFFCAIAGGAVAGIATNSARDFGCRLATIALWGASKKAWGGNYSAIGTLTSIPASIFAAGVYELLLYDQHRVVTRGFRDVIANSDAHRERKAYKYNLRLNQRHNRSNSTESPYDLEKQSA